MCFELCEWVVGCVYWVGCGVLCVVVRDGFVKVDFLLGGVCCRVCGRWYFSVLYVGVVSVIGCCSVWGWIVVFCG